MKTCLAWVLLLCAGFSLFAQSNNSSISVYVQQISGTGVKAEDNSLFTNAITFEIMARNYSIVRSERESDYTLRGALAPWNQEAPGQNPRLPLYSLYIEFSDSKSDKILAEQTLIYASWEEASGLIPVMVSNILAGNLPGFDKNSWQNKNLYIGAAAFWTPRIYSESSQSIILANFGLGISAELRLLGFLSLELGTEIAPDWVVADNITKNTYRDIVLEIPFSMKWVFKPGTSFLLEPYAGIQLNLSLLDTAKPPLFSWRAGLQYGIKAGPGILFIEPRFAMDIGDSTVKTESGNLNYHRNILYLGVGYKYGFFFW